MTTVERRTRLAIRPMTDADAAAVLAIYQAGIDTGDATFELAAPDWPRFCAGTLPDHRLVAVGPDTGQVRFLERRSRVVD